MGQSSLIQQIDAVANRIKSLESERGETVAKMKALEREKNEAVAAARALEREVGELSSLITLAGAKVDEILKIGATG
jgi:predicted  nucleic acid-binding Zn-ribbon protein